MAIVPLREADWRTSWLTERLTRRWTTAVYIYHWVLSWSLSITFITPQFIFLTILRIFYHLHLGLPSGQFPIALHTKILNIALIYPRGNLRVQPISLYNPPNNTRINKKTQLIRNITVKALLTDWPPCKAKHSKTHDALWPYTHTRTHTYTHHWK
jgi:hypothetical protein